MGNTTTLLQINVDANNGSNGSIARDIGDMALERGWESYIAYGRRHIPSNSTLLRVGSSFDVAMHGVESRLFDNHGLASRGVTKNFLSRVDEIKPDIIHLHNIHGYFINYRLLFKYITEHAIPVVWTLHDCWPFTGHCGCPINYECERYIDRCESCPARGSYPRSLFLDNSKNNYLRKKEIFNTPRNMRLVTVSKWLKSVTKQSAMVLINPRRPDGGITKYSFPSKTMEYLLSGTPMIGYKLEGIPEEYYSYYYTVNDLNESTLVNAMRDVMSKSQNELNQKARIAFNFIQENKTSKVQVPKIIDFLAK